MILTFEGLDVIESFSYYPPSNILPLTASDSLNLLTEEKIFFKRGICITGLSVLWRLLINVLKLYSFSCFILLVANIIRIVFRMPSKSDKFRGDFLTPVQLLHNSKSLINVVYFELTHPTYFFTRLLTSVISLFIKPAQIIIGCYYFIHYYNLFYAKIALKETIVFGEIRNGSIFYVCFVLVPKAGAFHRVYRLFRLRMGRKEDRFT